VIPDDGTYWLISADEQQVGSVRLSANAALLVGRAAHNHLVLNDYRISRQHARVTHERDGYYVYDLNSVNGTLVNDTKIRRHRLQLGDTVTFGPFVFHFEARAESVRNVSALPQIWQPGESITRFTESPIRFPDETPSGHLPVPAQPDFDLNSLEHAHKNLGILYEFVQAIGRTIERHELLELMGAKILEIFRAAASVSVYLREGEAENAPFTLAHHVGSASPIELRSEIRRAAIAAGGAIGDPSGKSRQSTAMYAPMLDRGTALGVICVAAGGKEAFSIADIELLSGMAAPATIALKNTWHHEQSLIQERIRRDLELAAQIQVSFLPREVISIAGFDFLASYRAAYTVGGDFYDIFWVGPQKLACFIGDISGKGIAAALLMARISGELRIAALAHVDPLHVLSIMNKAVLDRRQPELFFTAAFFTLDVSTGEVLLASGGHPSPFLCRANGDVVQVIDEGSTAVGMFEEPSFAAKRFVLEDRDSLVLFTDGVIEARDSSGALFGTERLAESLSGVGSFPDDISAVLLGSVERFAGPAEQNDDLTIFICHRCVGAPLALQPRTQTTGEVVPPPISNETYEAPSLLVDPRVGADTLTRRPPPLR
jgi:serine phosphatase RsbU (regulator of sigma subunit)